MTNGEKWLLACVWLLAGILAYLLMITVPAEFKKREAQPEPARVERFMGLPAAPDCSHLYNNDRSREWAACMGVPYRLRSKMKRTDI